EDGLRLRIRLLERHRAGDLERHLRRVDRVLLPVDERHTYAVHGGTCELAVFHRLAHALVDRGPVALRDDAADDPVDELVLGRVVAVRLDRLDDDLAVAELAAAAGLLLVAVPCASLPPDRLLVR